MAPTYRTVIPVASATSSTPCTTPSCRRPRPHGSHGSVRRATGGPRRRQPSRAHYAAPNPAAAARLTHTTRPCSTTLQPQVTRRNERDRRCDDEKHREVDTAP